MNELTKRAKTFSLIALILFLSAVLTREFVGSLRKTLREVEKYVFASKLIKASRPLTGDIEKVGSDDMDMFSINPPADISIQVPGEGQIVELTNSQGPEMRFAGYFLLSSGERVRFKRLKSEIEDFEHSFSTLCLLPQPKSEVVSQLDSIQQHTYQSFKVNSRAFSGEEHDLVLVDCEARYGGGISDFATIDYFERLTPIDYKKVGWALLMPTDLDNIHLAGQTGSYTINDPESSTTAISFERFMDVDELNSLAVELSERWVGAGATPEMAYFRLRDALTQDRIKLPVLGLEVDSNVAFVFFMLIPLYLSVIFLHTIYGLRGKKPASEEPWLAVASFDARNRFEWFLRIVTSGLGLVAFLSAVLLPVATIFWVRSEVSSWLFYPVQVTVSLISSISFIQVLILAKGGFFTPKV